MPLEEAVVDAGAVRFRPMLLTARGRGGRLGGHPVRPDLPGAGDLADGRRGGVAAAVESHRAGVVLHDGQAPGAEALASTPDAARGRKGPVIHVAVSAAEHPRRRGLRQRLDARAARGRGPGRAARVGRSPPCTPRPSTCRPTSRTTS
ncbi:MAG: hypothetical protein MZV70_43370 [Desulfobacterales bacterium]|nr:hypothetical protein [Desulfobacterales bacterium]